MKALEIKLKTEIEKYFRILQINIIKLSQINKNEIWLS